MFCGKIFIKVVSAENLADTVESRLTAKNDVPQLNPYVDINIDDIDVAKVGLSSSVQRHTRNPVWNHECEVIHVDFGEIISFAVYHDAQVKPDLLIGNCNIPISSLLEASHHNEPYKLKQSLDPSGYLKLEIKLEEEIQSFQRQEQVEKIYPIKGHKFRGKYFTQPVYCAHCDEFIWGLVGKQGLHCEHCSMTIHKRCYEDILAECPGITKPELEDDPEARMALTNKHIFQKSKFVKPTFCKQCGEFILGLGHSGYECKVCHVVVHGRCRDLTPSTCGVDLAEMSKILKDVKKIRENTMRSKPAIEAEQKEPHPTLVKSNKKTGERLTLDNFDILKLLGKGAFGKVLLAEDKETKEVFAIKAVEKHIIIEGDDVEVTLTERNVLALGWENRFLTKLHCSFQTNDRLFFVMEYLSGGDLMYHIMQSKKFPEERARFYTAEIIIALKFLHKKGIIYRDLKLDNVMLTNDGHIKIADFGMCKEGIDKKQTQTFCGTPNYIAPEIILGKKYGSSVDWWSLGILTYEMLAGRSPFTSQDEEELFRKIRKDPVKYPRWLSQPAQSLIGQFLVKTPADRLGSKPSSNIEAHEFFAGMNWNLLREGKIEPPFKPRLRSPTDTNNFDDDFTNEEPSLEDIEMSEAMQQICDTAFQGFSFYNQN